MNIVILGAPGSGKGTQSEMITKKFGLFYLQAGELAREWGKTNPRIQQIVEKGELVPEEEMTEYVKQYLEKNVPDTQNILFEGFPRFISQFEEYERWLFAKGQKIDSIVSLDITQDAAIRRLSSRGVCQKCGQVYNLVTTPPAVSGICKCGGSLIQRDDDKPESIKIRFEYYHNNTQKLISYLAGRGRLIRIDADRPIKTVFKAICDKLV